MFFCYIFNDKILPLLCVRRTAVHLCDVRYQYKTFVPLNLCNFEPKFLCVRRTAVRLYDVRFQYKTFVPSNLCNSEPNLFVLDCCSSLRFALCTKRFDSAQRDNDKILVSQNLSVLEPKNLPYPFFPIRFIILKNHFAQPF